MKNVVGFILFLGTPIILHNADGSIKFSNFRKTMLNITIKAENWKLKIFFFLNHWKIANNQQKYRISVKWPSLCKKCPYSELFRSLFSRIRTEYGEIRSISPYWVRMRENADQNNSEYGHFSRSAYYYRNLIALLNTAVNNFLDIPHSRWQDLVS